MNTLFSAGENPVTINGPVGPLEAAYSVPKSPDSNPIIAIICHPNPLQEGTMNNKVVTTIARTLVRAGHYALRFNYRGVGASLGEYSEGIGESEDLAAVVAWAKEHCPASRLWIIGFSFGGYVAYRLASELDLEHLLLIAPAVTRCDFTPLNTPDCKLTIVNCGADEVVDPNAITAFAKSLGDLPHLIQLEGVSHFFHGRLLELRDLVLGML